MQTPLEMDLESFFNYTFPWFVVGDFNSINNNGERIGGQPKPLVAKCELDLWGTRVEARVA